MIEKHAASCKLKDVEEEVIILEGILQGERRHDIGRGEEDENIVVQIWE